MAKTNKIEKPVTFYKTEDKLTKEPGKRNIKKLLLIIIILLVAILLLRSTGNYLKKIISRPIPTPTQAPDVLPKDWSHVDVTDKRILARVEKVINQDETQNVPVIIITKSQTQKKDNKAYVDELIVGAKKSFPGLVYDKDTILKTTPYTRMLIGSYWSGDQKITINQQITIKENKDVFTITGSFIQNQEQSIQDEINMIFDLFNRKYINN